MAKENTTKTVLAIVVSIIVVCGAVWAWATIDSVKAQVDSTQDGRIGAVESEVKIIERRVDSVDLKAAQDLGVKNAIFNTLGRMERVQQTLSNDVGQMKVDVATTKTKVENLEKAD